MRRLAIIIGALALALPPVAGALMRGQGDGTLVVDNANGVVTLRVTGGIIGRFDGPGSITVYDPNTQDGPAPVVKRCTDEAPGQKRFFCRSDTEVRFRMIGGVFWVRIDAIGLDLSVAGRGTATLDGSTFTDLQTGRYSLNGGMYQTFPGVQTRLVLGTPQPATLGSK